MAAEVPPPEAAAESSNVEVITNLNPNDVLLGRGTGPSNYVGNKAFRALCEERKEEYTSIDQYKPKARIAKEIFQTIRSKGGRFLCLVEDENEEEVRTEDDEKWVEVDEKTALEKCKQSLRERRAKSNGSKKRKKEGEVESAVMEPSMSTLVGVSGGVGGAMTPQGFAQVGAFSPLMAHMAPSMILGNGGLSTLPLVDTQLLLFHSMPFLQQQQQQQVAMNSQFPQLNLGMAVLPGSFIAGAPQQQGQTQDLSARYLADSLLCANPQGASETPQAVVGVSGSKSQDVAMAEDQPNYHTSRPASIDSLAVSSVEDASSDKEDAAFSLSSLSLSDRPRFTEQELELELATMTDEERAAVLVDTFGKLCKANRHKNKKARRDLDPKSIDFLIRHMRHEIDLIPKEQKPALLEALVKSRAEEFSDARLERFLRCDGMNARLAAWRFVKYWEGRREAFGEDKYLLPMTLSEALRDDVAAIEAGVYCLLPEKDLSGRQIIYLEPHRHTGEGYSAESLLRAFWYTMEVTSQDNTDISSGVVHVVWDKYSSISDYDRYVWERYIRFMTSAWPIKSVAIHSCCTPSFIVRIIKPILFALTNKCVRSRVVFHDVPESELLDSLSKFGILKDMVPTDMGGTVLLDRSEWIANRRALEMEEI